MNAADTLLIVDAIDKWPGDAGSIRIVAARDYLADPRYRQAARVINLCTRSGYQGSGYYVSLLAQARGQQPLPDVGTLEDLHAEALNRMLLADLADAIPATLAQVGTEATEFELKIYFGVDPDGLAPALAQTLFLVLPAPLLALRLQRTAQGRWQAGALRSLALQDIPPHHQPQLRQAMLAYAIADKVAASQPQRRRRERHKPALAILYDPTCRESPSNAGAIDCFRQAALSLDMHVDLITAAERGRLAEFDALFIRDTTAIRHYTYQLARSAAHDGLVVMDDPASILQCTNKIYLDELFGCHGIPTPNSLVLQRHDIERVIPALGLPCILKQPDGAFSRGVVKIESAQQLAEQAAVFLAESDLILAQEWLPTAFDWRIGVLDRQPLFACKYFMAPGHWQIIKRRRDIKLSEGQAAAVPLAQVPPPVLHTALAAANLIGDGFYGVDLKQDGARCCLIEINDNPNVDMGNEDGVLHEVLYRQVMQVFRRRIDAINAEWSMPS